MNTLNEYEYSVSMNNMGASAYTQVSALFLKSIPNGFLFQLSFFVGFFCSYNVGLIKINFSMLDMFDRFYL
jgi:hypothetical protein